MQTNEVFTGGRRGCLACLTVTEWPDGLVHVCGEEEHITQAQVRRWALKHYPGCDPVWKDFGRGYVGVRFRLAKEGESCQK